MGWLTINLGVVNAYGLSDGRECDTSLTTSVCDPYVKLFIDGKWIHDTSSEDDITTYNVDYQYVSEKIKKSSEIKIQIWDKDWTTLWGSDELIFETIGDVNSFLNEPYRGGQLFESINSFLTIQNSINTYSFWEDEYEKTK